MRFAPSASEYRAIGTMAGQELMEYFITRVAEVEEVWGLGDETGWVMRELGEQTSLPVWPYQQLAHRCAVDDWQGQSCKSVSLEHFISHILKLLIEQDIQIEIMPGESRQGYIMEPQHLYKMFEGVIESGEYFLEG